MCARFAAYRLIRQAGSSRDAWPFGREARRRALRKVGASRVPLSTMGQRRSGALLGIVLDHYAPYGITRWHKCFFAAGLTESTPGRYAPVGTCADLSLLRLSGARTTARPLGAGELRHGRPGGHTPSDDPLARADPNWWRLPVFSSNSTSTVRARRFRPLALTSLEKRPVKAWASRPAPKPRARGTGVTPPAKRRVSPAQRSPDSPGLTVTAARLTVIHGAVSPGDRRSLTGEDTRRRHAVTRPPRCRARHAAIPRRPQNPIRRHRQGPLHSSRARPPDRR